ncbi:MAG TPA: calcium-binding protein [Allosphingosinicella sp.]
MATITGTIGYDTLTGTSGDDLIEGLAGGDSLTGAEGADELRGGDDNDQLFGGAGNDTLLGGAGSDYLVDGDGDDKLDGGADIDNLNSSSGMDELIGGEGDDWITAVRGSLPSDTIHAFGGIGNDKFSLSLAGPSTVFADGGEGDDSFSIQAPEGKYVLTLGAGSDEITLGSNLALMANVPVAITITDFQTGPGGDRFDFSGLTWYFQNWDHNTNPFATGHMRLIQDGANALLQVRINTASGTFATIVTFSNTSAEAFTYDNLDGFPRDGSVPAGLTLNGTEDGDLLTGAAGADMMNGFAGNDTIFGGSGIDTILGGAGGDTLFGEGGDDVIDGGDDVDYIYDGYGNDIVHGGLGNDSLNSGDGGSDTLLGEAGNDTISVQRGSSNTDKIKVEGGEGDDTVSLFAYGVGSEITIDGGIGADTIRVFSLASKADITLGAGSDLISLEDEQNRLLFQGSIIVRDFEAGEAGDRLDLDTWLGASLYGWDQSNPFKTGHLSLVQKDADTLLLADWDGSAGSGTARTVITFKNVQKGDLVAANLGGYAPDGSPPAGLTIIGTSASETLVGGPGSDRIEGRGGYDTLEGEGGDDILIAGPGNSTLHGGSGNDELTSGDQGGILNGQTGDDIVHGGLGDDYVNYGDGADVMHGGGGADRLYFYQDGETGKTSYGYGEAGADYISVRAYNVAHVIVDGGEGDDLFEIGAIAGSALITLGSGIDRIFLEGDIFGGYYPGTTTITDFAAGPAGDFLDLPFTSQALLTGIAAAANPFATGHLRLVQSGADTLIQMDRNGGGDSFATVLTLAGVQASGLTAANLGYTSTAVYGTTGADQLRAGAGTNVLIGRSGNDVYRVDSFADTVTELAGEGVDRVETALGSKTDYTQLYILPAFVENLTGTSASDQGVRGNALNNVVVMGSGHDLVVLDDGGNDSVSGGAGNDFIYYGATFAAGDSVDGGSGSDTVGLLGNYNLALTAAALTGVEQLALYTGSSGGGGSAFSYTITTHDSNVASGQQLFVNAVTLAAGETLVFNGSAETNGRFKVVGGRANDIIAGGAKNDNLAGEAGSDTLYGLAGNDSLYGGDGGDLLNGGVGSDTFLYLAAADSTGTAFDRLFFFEAAVDRIDLPFAVSGVTGKVSGSLSAAGFDAALAAAVDGSLEAFSAVLFRADSGEYQGRAFAVVDGNGDGSYQAGQDYVLEFVTPGQPLDIMPPIFV